MISFLEFNRRFEKQLHFLNIQDIEHLLMIFDEQNCFVPIAAPFATIGSI